MADSKEINVLQHYKNNEDDQYYPMYPITKIENIIGLTPEQIGAATAAQGVKADNALPKSGGEMSGIITTKRTSGNGYADTYATINTANGRKSSLYGAPDYFGFRIDNLGNNGYMMLIPYAQEARPEGIVGFHLNDGTTTTQYNTLLHSGKNKLHTPSITIPALAAGATATITVPYGTTFATAPYPIYMPYTSGSALNYSYGISNGGGGRAVDGCILVIKNISGASQTQTSVQLSGILMAM